MSIIQPDRTGAVTSPVPVGPTGPSSGGTHQDVNNLEVDPAPHATAKAAPSTHASRAWNGVVPAVVLLAFILVFVFQNLHKARVSFLVVSGTLPLAVALLGAAAFGGLFVLALGSARIMQLRKVIRHNARANAHAGSPVLHAPKGRQ
jgi:uncharacterized integral membrane protein